MIRTILIVGLLMMASCSESQQVQEKVVVDGTQSGHQVVTAEAFKAQLADEGIQLVDVRTPGEYAGGTINDAINIDFNSPNFKEEIAKLDKSKKTLIFCAAGGRSGKAGQMMEEMGFELVVDLSSGYGGWPYK